MPMPDAIANLAPLSLEAIAAMAGDRALPPVDKWHPAREGVIDIRIARDGRWFHEGGEIRRESMVRLFSTILRREADGGHVLVTPAEKLSITVEDTAFVAVELKTEEIGKARTLAFRLNTGDIVIADASHRLSFSSTAGEPRPVLHVRGGLEARLSRSVFIELANMALEEAASPPGVWSMGEFFSMADLL